MKLDAPFLLVLFATPDETSSGYDTWNDRRTDEFLRAHRDTGIARGLYLQHNLTSRINGHLILRQEPEKVSFEFDLESRLCDSNIYSRFPFSQVVTR
jgi:hypothetical protein